ncbi:MAG: hypothetical protein E6H73_15575 [Betaproteobacteria bacterium]|nr:MAG: hypothetical protein E6H73_15575 [Betaproteobacteria bacterium]
MHTYVTIGCMIYTSGTTGPPKGALRDESDRRNRMARLVWMTRQHELGGLVPAGSVALSAEEVRGPPQGK